MRFVLFKIRKFTWPALALFLLPALHSCVKEDKHEIHDSIAIGWIGPKSGIASVLGVDSYHAVEMAIDDFRAKNSNVKIEFFGEDDQYQSRNSIVKYETLTAKHPIDLLILLTYSAMEKIAPLAARDHVIVINPIDNDQNLSHLNENIFLIAKRTENLAELMSTQLANEGRKKTFLLNNIDNEFMSILAANVESQLTSKGIQTIYANYDDKTINFRPILQQGKLLGADSFVMLGYESVGFAIKQARKMGFKRESIYTANLGASVRNAAGAFADNVSFTDYGMQDVSPRVREFEKKYQARYRKLPDMLWTALQSYDAMALTLNGINESMSKDHDVFTSALKAHLHSVEGYVGLSGTISILPDGESTGIFWSLYQWSSSGGAKRVLHLDEP